MNFEEIADPVERVRFCLRATGCSAEIVHTEETIFTVDDASRVVGAPPEEILKSILFSLDDGERWALALMSGANRVNDKKIRKLLDAKKIRMGSVEAIFAFSRFAPGGIPPVGYTGQPISLLDDDLFRFDVVWAAAGTDHDFFPISPEELLRITAGSRADIKK